MWCIFCVFELLTCSSSPVNSVVLIVVGAQACAIVTVAGWMPFTLSIKVPFEERIIQMYIHNNKILHRPFATVDRVERNTHTHTHTCMATVKLWTHDSLTVHIRMCAVLPCILTRVHYIRPIVHVYVMLCYVMLCLIYDFSYCCLYVILSILYWYSELLLSAIHNWIPASVCCSVVPCTNR